LTQGIANDTVDALNSRFLERFDKIFCCGFAHDLSPCFLIVFSSQTGCADSTRKPSIDRPFATPQTRAKKNMDHRPG
jgi:hypothetical protein